MRSLFVSVLTLLFLESYSQQSDTAFVNPFKWHTEKNDRESLMFLEVAYQRDNSDSIEFLTISVAKDRTKARPEFISVVIPGNIDHSNGVFITFAKTVIKNDNPTLELQNEMPVRVNFEHCDSFCTAKVVNGIVMDDDGSKKDLFQKFLTFDNVLFLFMYPDGTHKSVAVPLSYFRDQYVDL